MKTFFYSSPLLEAKLLFLGGLLCTTGCLANPALVTFDDSPAYDQLTREFNQTGATLPYVESPSGGISGGSVVAYSGSDYRATAVYNQASYDLSQIGMTAELSMDVFFHPDFTPLVPGANGVRSFRLGVVNSATSSFETYGEPSLYLDGVFSLDTNQMLFVARSSTQGMLSETLSESTLASDHWYRADLTLTNVGNEQIRVYGSFSDLGALGMSNPYVVASWDSTLTNSFISKSSSNYAAFSALSNGGVFRADNFSSPVPEPTAGSLATIAVAMLFLARQRRGNQGAHRSNCGAHASEV
jgi:nicotinamide mononucleotide (NMN) deamidase PncC